ncbi:MAG: BrnT family toxin [Phycisphaerales bacterium]|jgi:uncharacterized DUF497 family protein|nr:BrnT family toxin [Phycisphaerales bacterium]
MYDFRWNEDNESHIGEHGIVPDEAEHVVNHARRPYPRRIEDGKYLVLGQTRQGVYLQVIFIINPNRTLYIIHARPLSEREKIRYRRNRK